MRGLLAVGWCQGVFARTAQGAQATLGSPDAVAFCILGASSHLTVLAGKPTYAMHPEAREAIRALVALVAPGVPFDGPMGRYGAPLVAWNEAPERTQAEVLALVDRAIAEVSSRPEGPPASV
jgi:hypothetical protein